jgi:hypothetical protein
VQHVAQLEHDRRDAAGVPEVLDQVPAGRLHVGQDRHAPVNPVEVVDADVNPRLAGDHRQVEQRVGRAADGGVQDDRVLERVAGQDAPRREVLLDQCD